MLVKYGYIPKGDCKCNMREAMFPKVGIESPPFFKFAVIPTDRGINKGETTQCIENSYLHWIHEGW